MKSASLVVLSLFMVLTHPGYAQTGDTTLGVLTTEVEGMHRISYEQLRDEGLDLAGLKHRKFALLSGGQSVAIRTKGQNKQDGPSSRFGRDGFVEFYAEASDDLYNQERAYVLVYDRNARLSMASETARPNNGTSITEYTHVEQVERETYYDYLSPSKTDPWHFGRLSLTPFFSTPDTQVNVDLVNLVGNTADISFNVYGIVDVQSEVDDHNMVVKVNGATVGETESFDGNVQHDFSKSDAPVNEGQNTISLGLVGVTETPFDVVGLNELKVSYKRSAIATGPQLQGKFAQGQAEVAGIGGQASVYRKDANGLTYLRQTKSQSGSVRFVTQQEADYVVVSQGGHHAPQVKLLPEFEDITSGEAEYLVLTHANFQGPALQTLVQLRSVDYSVKVVDVAQVYAQFGDSLPSAVAISAYINFAATNMGTRFVTLVGSDTLDYKNFGNSNSVSFIPTQYAETPGGFLFVRQTPSDASYGDLDGDNVPDVAVGRLSVRTQAELTTVVEKIQDYQARVNYAGRILIAADAKDVGNGVSFSDDVAAIIDAIPVPDWQSSIRSDYRALPDVDGATAAKAKIENAINAGVSVAAYIGHSSQQQWSRTSPALLKGTEISALNNIDKPTLVTQWGCWNTYFVDPSGNSMADRFLVGGEQGAVTVLGASTLTNSEAERDLGIELSKLMYLEGKPIGEAVVEAKQALAQNNPGATDVLLGWQIIGDPALVINPK